MREKAAFDIVLPVITNLGSGETRRIGPGRVVFATAIPIETGDELRFTIRLRGTSSMAFDLFCSGLVRSVTMEETCFVVDSSIERTVILPAFERGTPAK